MGSTPPERWRARPFAENERPGDRGEERGQGTERSVAKGSAEAGDHGSELLSACVVVHFFSSCRYGVTDGTLGPPEAGDGWQSCYEGRPRGIE